MNSLPPSLPLTMPTQISQTTLIPIPTTRSPYITNPHIRTYQRIPTCQIETYSLYVAFPWSANEGEAFEL